MVLEHGIGECCGHSDEHPPYEAEDEIATAAADQCRDDFSIELGDIKGEERAQDEEDAVREKQAQFFAFPAGDHDLEQAQQVPKELAIYTHSLLLLPFFLVVPFPRVRV